MTTQRTAVAFLVLGVREWFAAEGLSTPILFGRREWAKQSNQGPGGANRIVIRAGDDSGAAGEILAPLNHGANPRNLRTFDHRLDVSIWGVDASAQDDELAQHEAVHSLFLSFVRAVQDVSKADAVYGSPRLVVSPLERTFGAMLIVPVRLRGTMPALADDVVHPAHRTIARAWQT